MSAVKAAVVIAALAVPNIPGVPYVLWVDGTQKGGFTRTWNDGHKETLPPIHQARLTCADEPTYPEFQYCMGLIDGKYPEWTTLKSTLAHQ